MATGMHAPERARAIDFYNLRVREAVGRIERNFDFASLKRRRTRSAMATVKENFVTTAGRASATGVR